MASTYTAARVACGAQIDWTKIAAVELVHQPWLEPCDIGARAQLCHDGERLYVRMEAKEKKIRATLTGPLDQVCNDSCLEFFFAPMADDSRYINFEVNPLCNVYVGFGAGRPTRVRQIVRDADTLFGAKAEYTDEGWVLTYSVPAEFIRRYFPAFEMKGEAACNFYKCGDLTEKKHYLA